MWIKCTDWSNHQMKLLTFILILLCSFASNGQQYLNDTTLFNRSYCSFISPYEVDSGYFLMGEVTNPEHLNEEELLLAFVDTLGNFHSILEDHDTANYQRVFSGLNELFQNHDGNFIYFYNNCDSNACYPRFKEITPQGVVVDDIKFDSIVLDLQLACLDYSNIYQKEFDSSYVLMINVSDSTLPNTVHRGGVLLVHLDKYKTIIDTVYIDSPTNSTSYYSPDMVELDSGHVILMVADARLGGSNINEEGFVKFYCLDSGNNILSEHSYADEQRTILPFGFRKSHEEDGYLFTYMASEWDSISNWEEYNTICKIDTNFNLVWKSRIKNVEVWEFEYHFQNEVKRTLDGNYIICGGGSDTYDLYQPAAMLTKYNDSGSQLWQRHIYRVPYDPLQIQLGGPAVLINDVIATSDSGFFLTGHVKDYLQLNQGNPYNYGYAIKTNCLGFLGEPIASANHTELDSLQVQFSNSSMQAGSYDWYFGDGDSLQNITTSEEITHSYPSMGTYSVTLIANGCNGVADTISFDVQAQQIGDTTSTTDIEGNFIAYPNPVSFGDDITVFINPIETDQEIQLCLSDINGRIVQCIQVPKTGGTFLLPNQFAAGMYHLSLYVADKELQHQKILIQ